MRFVSTLAALTLFNVYTNALPPDHGKGKGPGPEPAKGKGSGPPSPSGTARDECARAVSAGPARPPQGVECSEIVKSDCSSILSKIIVPCPATLTTILTSTKTAKGVTRTSTKSATITATSVATSFVTVNSSIYSTDQRTQLTTLVVPVNSTSLTTETATTTSTVYETLLLTTTFSTAVVNSTAVTTATPKPLQRRQTSVSTLPDRPHPTEVPEVPSNVTLFARQQYNSQCKPVTFTPNDIPDYAAPCRDPWSYSSACQQLGHTGKTLTLPASSTYITRTTLTTTTPTLIVNVTKSFKATTTSTLTIPVTNLQTRVNTLTTTQTLTTTTTSVLTSTLTSLITTNTTATTTVPVSLVATSTEITTSTYLATPTACPSAFRLTISNTPIGTYLRALGASDKLSFTPLALSATTFSLDSSNRLFVPSTNEYLNTDPSGLYYIYTDSQATIDNGGYSYMACSEPVEGGKLSCKAGSGRGDQGRFWWCPVIAPPDALVWGTDEERIRAGGWDCVGLGVEVECV